MSDITQHPTAQGWLYLAVVLDVFSRRIVGWSMGEHVSVDLALGSLNIAIATRRPGPGLVYHSDHGAQYTSLAFGARLREAGILGSMGSVGDAYDNAVAESFWATLQTELLDREPWPTRAALRSAIFEDIEGSPTGCGSTSPSIPSARRGREEVVCLAGDRLVRRTLP